MNRIQYLGLVGASLVSAVALACGDSPGSPSSGPCGVPSGVQCGVDTVCDVRACGADVAGMCVAKPAACEKIYDPVCGCDGNTYGNDCQRLGAGAALASSGPCHPGPGPECGGFAGTPCPNPTAEICDIHGCGNDLAGSCVTRPGSCPTVVDPVCGCDGITYTNNCERLQAGAALMHNGACWSFAAHD